MGFDKIRRQQAELKLLKVVILDGMRIDSDQSEGLESIRDTCTRIARLDLSRNLFESLEPVARICRDLPDLRSLTIK